MIKGAASKIVEVAKKRAPPFLRRVKRAHCRTICLVIAGGAIALFVCNRNRWFASVEVLIFAVDHGIDIIEKVAEADVA